MFQVTALTSSKGRGLQSQCSGQALKRRPGCDRHPPALLKKGGEAPSHSICYRACRNSPASSQPRGEQPRTVVFLKLEFISDGSSSSPIFSSLVMTIMPHTFLSLPPLPTLRTALAKRCRDTLRTDHHQSATTNKDTTLIVPLDWSISLIRKA